ncbi:acylphosphatase [Desulforudis sp. 1088]|uniref:acylphosphatase n=1 Tax=unclassified Candidatus Desulforudis TaxID=2635950 RepID=UPI00348F6192
MSRIIAEVRITGKVQGVYFRWATQQEARQRGLTGWVRNNPDGSVSALFEGEEEQVAEMLKWCRSGPPAARVDKVETTYKPARDGDARFKDFSITR